MPSGNTLQKILEYISFPNPKIPLNASRNWVHKIFLPQSQQFLNLSILPQTELQTTKLDIYITDLTSKH